MAEIQMEKIKRILASMDDDYWQSLIEQNNTACNTAKELTTMFVDALTALTVTQFNIIETKHSGYKRLVENKKKSAVAGIVSENKTNIDALTKQKYDYIATLTDLLAAMMAVVEQVRNLGVNQGGESH